MNGKFKKIIGIILSLAVLLSIVSACTPASVDITPGSTPDMQAMTTPEITAEPTEEPTAKPTPKPTMTPAPTPIGEPKRLVYAEGDEMPEYDDSVYDEYDIVTIYFPEGNAYEQDPAQPFGVTLLLPKGWTYREDQFEGMAYYPIQEFADECLAYLSSSTKRTIYDGNGDCVGTIGYGCHTWQGSGEDFEEFVSSFEEIYGPREEWKASEVGKGIMGIAFWSSMLPHRSLDIDHETTYSVTGGRNACNLVTTTSYSEVLNDKYGRHYDNIDDRMYIMLPAVASFDIVRNVGIFIEFADGILEADQLEMIAESIRFCGLEW